MIFSYKKKKLNLHTGKHEFFGVSYRNPITHKPTTKRGFLTKTEAKNWCTNEMSRLLKQGHEDSTKTFNDVVSEWLLNKKDSVSGSTYLKYESQARNHLTDAFGNKLIKDVTVDDCQKIANQLAKRMTRADKLITTFRNVFNYAMKHEFINRNPFSLIEMPKLKKQDSEPNSFTMEQLIKFKTGVKEYYAGKPEAVALLLLLADTGMRKGEALGLRWSDIDFDNLVVNIQHSVTRKNDGTLTADGNTKNKFSKRQVVIGKNLSEFLLKWKKAQFGYSFANDYNLVFTSNHGGILSPSKPGKWMNMIKDKYDLPNVNVHGLRHTFTVLSIAAGINVNEVAAILGHADATITIKVYNDLHPTLNQDSAKLFDQL